MKGKFYVDREIELLLIPVHPETKENKKAYKRYHHSHNKSILPPTRYQSPSFIPKPQIIKAVNFSM